MRGKLVNNILQASIGAFTAVILFFALRTDPISINKWAGLIITAIWIYACYVGSGIDKQNFILSVVVTFIVSGIMAVVFNVVTTSELVSLDYFGGAAIVGVWMGLPVALIMDKYNVSNYLKRFYVER